MSFAMVTLKLYSEGVIPVKSIYFVKVLVLSPVFFCFHFSLCLVFLSVLFLNAWMKMVSQWLCCRASRKPNKSVFNQIRFAAEGNRIQPGQPESLGKGVRGRRGS